MKNRILIIIWAVLVIALLVGCGDERIIRHKERRFQVLETYEDCVILVDRETGIGYLKTVDTGGVGITVMYDSDGNIYRPNGWRDYGE